MIISDVFKKSRKMITVNVKDYPCHYMLKVKNKYDSQPKLIYLNDIFTKIKKII